MDSGLNPFGQFLQASATKSLLNQHPTLLAPTPTRFFKGWDEMDKEGQDKKFAEVMHELKDYV